VREGETSAFQTDMLALCPIIMSTLSQLRMLYDVSHFGIISLERYLFQRIISLLLFFIEEILSRHSKFYARNICKSFSLLAAVILIQYEYFEVLFSFMRFYIRDYFHQ